MSTLLLQMHHVQFVAEIIALAGLEGEMSREVIGDYLLTANYQAYANNYGETLTMPEYVHVAFEELPKDDLFIFKQLFFVDYQCDWDHDYRETVAGKMMLDIMNYYLTKLTQTRYPAFKGKTYSEFVSAMNDTEIFNDLPYGLDEPYVSMKKLKADALRKGLRQCTGSERVYKSALFCSWIFHTQGTKYLADKAGAYWLIDIIVSYMSKPKFKKEPFQVWKLARYTGEKEGVQWVVTCTDGGKGTKPVQLCRQEIPYSDFPLEEGITLWVEDGSADGKNLHKIIMLPSER